MIAISTDVHMRSVELILQSTDVRSAEEECHGSIVPVSRIHAALFSGALRVQK